MLAGIYAAVVTLTGCSVKKSLHAEGWELTFDKQSKGIDVKKNSMWIQFFCIYIISICIR